jgi:hypothetical protein
MITNGGKVVTLGDKDVIVVGEQAYPHPELLSPEVVSYRHVIEAVGSLS